MELLHIFFTSVGSVVALFLLTKIMGNKQMSQLNLFDYINGITIGSIAAEMATSLEDDFLKPLISLLVYTGASVLMAYANYKSIKLRKILTGKALILFENGKLYKGNLRKARIDLNEFLTQCRSNGYFNLANLQSAILETNGKISFLPTSAQRPVAPKDLDLNPVQETPLANVIIDGKIMKEILKLTGNNEKWLEKQLQAQGLTGPEEVFLATCDNENNLTTYVKINQKMKRDIFE